MSKILLIGSGGSMGTRYQAILRHLGHQTLCIDVGHNRHYVSDEMARSDGIIIASPTETHEHYIRMALRFGKPVLCEKPVTMDIVALRHLLEDVKTVGLNFTMMTQYKLLLDGAPGGSSYYDYFRTGKDGLVWDTMQIIGLADGDVTVANQSPVWRCAINGKWLTLAQMDQAYVDYVKQWIHSPGQDLGEIREMHEKAAKKAREYQIKGAHGGDHDSLHRDTGAVH